MDLIKQLTDEELDMMDSWRQYYAYTDSASVNNSNPAPMTEALKPWAQAKSEHLAQLFGGKLILSKDITYEKDKSELEEEISDFLHGSYVYGRVGRSPSTFYSEYKEYIFFRAKEEHGYTEEIRENLYSLVSEENLLSNFYDGETFTIEGKNGKPMKIQHGCKVVRALGKLADLYNLEGYEDFRLCHSQILNQKSLTGKLSISIHPMDYMTMSDNDSDWESCMNWRSNGSYRQGSVEMMNSTIVVVAYLEAEAPMYTCAKYKWNNKKWRQLFLVDPAAILAIKSYPYINSDLTIEVIKWLAELAKENLGWVYGDVEEFNPDDYALGDSKGHLFNISLETNSMYNDFGSTKTHFIALCEANLDDRLVRHTLYLPYSGVSECMICGSTTENFEDDSCLACNNCQSNLVCDVCGDYTSEDDCYIIDDRTICSYCYDNRVFQCHVCGDEHLDENLEQIYVMARIEENSNYFLKCNAVMLDRYSFRVCPDCLDDFEKEYLIPESHLRWGSISKYQNSYFVYPEDLTEEAIGTMTWSTCHTPGDLNEEIADHRWGERVWLTEKEYN